MSSKKEFAGLAWEYARWLRGAERSEATVEKYVRALCAYMTWLDGGSPSRESAAAWREHLVESGYSVSSVNAMVAAVNGYFRFAGAPEMQIKPLRMQRRMFREDRRELTNREYERLVSAAGSLGRERLALVMETVCAAGIRVGEVKYITVEAARSGRAEVRLKGKVRVILLPAKLSRKLLAYAKRHKITAGEVFVTRGGKSLSRKQIWAEMKSLCALAGVAASKVFPHNLRHLFARTFYAASRDVAKLADVLGHSSIETTRIYLISTGSEHIKALDRLNLVS